MNWEDSVKWLREQESQRQLVLDCYYDDPVENSVRRFHRSEEFRATISAIGPVAGRRLLDLGAGRGIASYAFSQEGALVTALEPDPSRIVGAGAIELWAQRLGANVQVVQDWGERLSFADGSFDLVYARAVLHHARDLAALCREVARVLQPGGRLLAVREHVVSNAQQMTTFLRNHPLHHLYGGEHAYSMLGYLRALVEAGFTPTRLWGSFDTPMNFAPATSDEIEGLCSKVLQRRLGLAGEVLARNTLALRTVGRWMSVRDQTPGRHVAILCTKGTG